MKIVWKLVREYGISVVFLFLGLYFLYLGKAEVINHEYTGAQIFFAVSFILFVITFLSKFKKIKFPGFDGELWNDKQKEAADLIKQMKELLLSLSKSACMSLGGIGRFAGSVPIPLVLDSVSDIGSMLRKIGASQEEIMKIRAPFDRLIIFDIARPIQQQIQQDIGKEAKKLQFIDENGVGCWKEGGNALVVKATSDLNQALNTHSSTNEDLLLRIKKYCIEAHFFGNAYYDNLRDNVCFLEFKNLESYINNRDFYDISYFLERKK